jgi:hypothetical protein
MAHYKAAFTPRKSPAGRYKSHLRAVDVIFTAPDDEEAKRRVRDNIVAMFIRSGDDFDVELQKL